MYATFVKHLKTCKRDTQQFVENTTDGGRAIFFPLSHRTTGNGAGTDTGYDEYQIVILTDEYQIVTLTDKY